MATLNSNIIHSHSDPDAPLTAKLDSYTIQGTDKVVYVGDSVLMRHLENEDALFVARIERFETDINGGNVMVEVKKYYRPEESVGGKREFHGKKELLLSDCVDHTQIAHTIIDKCIVYTLETYVKLKDVGQNEYFCRFELNATTGYLEPDRVAVYCKCELPWNPDDFMITCKTCRESYHPSCLNMTIDEAKKLVNFTCDGCRSKDGKKGSADPYMDLHRENMKACDDSSDRRERKRHRSTVKDKRKKRRKYSSSSDSDSDYYSASDSDSSGSFGRRRKKRSTKSNGKHLRNKQIAAKKRKRSPSYSRYSEHLPARRQNKSPPRGRSPPRRMGRSRSITRNRNRRRSQSPVRSFSPVERRPSINKVKSHHEPRVTSQRRRSASSSPSRSPRKHRKILTSSARNRSRSKFRSRSPCW